MKRVICFAVFTLIGTLSTVPISAEEEGKQEGKQEGCCSEKAKQAEVEADDTLARLLDAMNTSVGERKQEAMAALLNQLVKEQREKSAAEKDSEQKESGSEEKCQCCCEKMSQDKPANAKSTENAEPSVPPKTESKH
jgi:hypothetical protein